MMVSQRSDRDALGGVNAVAGRALMELDRFVAQEGDAEAPAPQGMRGLLVGKLNAALGGDEARHTFLGGAFGTASSKQLSLAQALGTLRWMEDWSDKLIDVVFAIEALRVSKGQEATVDNPELVEQEQIDGEDEGAETGAQAQSDDAGMYAGNAVEHTEARVVLWSDWYDRNGAKWSITMREGASGELLLGSIKNAEKVSDWLAKRGWRTGSGSSAAHPMNVERCEAKAPQTAAPQAPQAPQTAAPQAPQAPQTAAPQAPQAPQTAAPQTAAPTGAQKRGTGQLEKLIIHPEGKIEMSVTGLRYPLSDSRGAGIVSTLFDEALQTAGWNEALLSQEAVYGKKQFGTVFVDWVKGDKYYDVVSVHL